MGAWSNFIPTLLWEAFTSTGTHYLNDLWNFNPVGQVWKSLSGSIQGAPTPRELHGLTSAQATLYLLGGSDFNNSESRTRHSFGLKTMLILQRFSLQSSTIVKQLEIKIEMRLDHKIFSLIISVLKDIRQDAWRSWTLLKKRKDCNCNLALLKTMHS